MVVHGGAGQFRRASTAAEQDRSVRAGLATALDAGGRILGDGGTAIDAVEAAVRVLEDDPAFNAGRGAALTIAGAVALDAAIMDGATRAAGAVAGITATRHPVALARAVMADTPHVLLAGPGADGFAASTGLEQVAPDWFVTPERRRHLAELLARDATAFDVEMKYGTVGAVARDATGRLAAATSTGGVTGKRWGRIGDSPLIGAGTWADQAVAVSCTGSGEHFIRAAAAHAVAARVALVGDAPGVAADAVLAEIAALGGSGGMIVVGRDAATWRFTTPGMYRGLAEASGARTIAIYDDE